MWYISIRNAQLNASRGRNGIVGVYFTHGMSNIFEKFTREGLNNRKGLYLERALPYKYSGVHYCFDNNPLAIGMQTALMMSLGRYARVRLRSHCGKNNQPFLIELQRHSLSLYFPSAPDHFYVNHSFSSFLVSVHFLFRCHFCH